MAVLVIEHYWYSQKNIMTQQVVLGYVGVNLGGFVAELPLQHLYQF